MFIVPSKIFALLEINRRVALLINALISTTAMLFFVLQKKQITGFGFCIFQNIFHFPCPGCGITTALYYTLTGHVMLAIKINFASPVFLICQAGMLLTAILQCLNHKITPVSVQKYLTISESIIIVSIALSYLTTIINKTLHLWPM